MIWSAREGAAHADGSAIGDTTSFNVGSISKPLTAWAVLALAERGEIELDAPVTDYLSQYEIPHGEFDLDEVTVRRLLQHTAGTNQLGYGGYGTHEEQPVDALELSTSFAQVGVVREPGQRRAYSGGGYVLLQMMIEDVTRGDFDEAMQELVFAPLAMSHSGFAPEALPDSSSAFSYYGQPIEDLRDVALAAAGAYVSGADMERFLLAHLDGGGVLSAASLETAFAPTEVRDTFAMSYTRWETPEGILLGHGGNNSTWHGQIYVRPETGDGFYFITNTTGGAQLDIDLSCAWLSMMEAEIGDEYCNAALAIAHKLSWASFGILGTTLFIVYWLTGTLIQSRRSFAYPPRARGVFRLVLRMFAFVIMTALFVFTIWVSYTNSVMWRTEVVLIDEIPFNELEVLTAGLVTLFAALVLLCWSSPRKE